MIRIAQRSERAGERQGIHMPESSRGTYEARIQIVPATLAHAARIQLRAADAREIAAQGLEKMPALEFSLARSVESLAYLVDGEVAALHGCGKTCMLGGIATPWFITGTPVERVKKDLLRLAKARVQELHRKHGYLMNYVHAEYREAVRFMGWLGFEIEAARPFGPLGAPFHRIHLKGETHGN